MPGVLVLTGETASGKTALAIELAERFDAEIVGADSRQIYRCMPIGTAAPSEEELARVPHHLIGFVDPYERYSAARYVADALGAIAAIHMRGKRAIVVGGTGFYVRALCGDVDLGPQVMQTARVRVQRECALHDAEFLHGWLQVRSPARAAEVHIGDRYRVARALETMLGGEPDTPPPRHDNLRTRGIAFAKVWVQSDAEVLAERIALRVDRMMSYGFLDEAERVGAAAIAASAVGYPHALAYLGGRSTLQELCTLMIRTTRQYAKRQATWLRSEPGLVCIAAGTDVMSQIRALVSHEIGWTTQ